jgi:predicted  nucleic acid-binding Zn-ribbon protein
MKPARCTHCGAAFDREARESWKTLCPRCRAAEYRRRPFVTVGDLWPVNPRAPGPPRGGHFKPATPLRR